jgi:hypothetical protein
MSAELIPALIAMLCKENKSIHIIWLGADATHSLYETLDNNLYKAGVHDQVHFVSSNRTGAQIFSSLHVFLLPSNDVSLSLINLKLGLRGIPFVCFENSELASEYLEAGIGKAVPYLDLNGMVKAVLFYYQNRDHLQSEKERIAATTRKNYLTDIQAPRLWNLLEPHYDESEVVPDNSPVIAILVHIFYDDTWKELKFKLNFFKDKNAQFLFSISEACLIKEELVKDIRTSFKNAYILTTANIGKDIGGKFALIDFYLSLELESDYIIFLHDKQSPHSLIGEEWKNNLQKIIEYKNYNQILRTFEQDQKVGIVGAKEHLISEYDNTNHTFLNNNDKIHEFLRRYNISITNYEFFGGTMYWVRTSIIRTFFMKHNPMEIRSELEAGNVLDNHGSTNAHTWERVLSWVASGQGYRLQGI